MKVSVGLSDSDFDLTSQVAVITGGGGLLGRRHGVAIARAGGIAVLVARRAIEPLPTEFDGRIVALVGDVTSPSDMENVLQEVLSRYGRIDILINNAANNPKQENFEKVPWSRLESFPIEQWHKDIAVGLTGALICSKIFGSEMASRGNGVILNIASDLALIGPDQRLYQKDGVAADQQPVKPVSYSVVKAGLLGLTMYLATYWAEKGVRVNSLSLGGVQADQPEQFVTRLEHLIPMGRMARPDEFEAAVLFLTSDASSYMTGANLVMDGGRTCW